MVDFKKEIQKAKDKSKKRKFNQSIELIFNFKNVDFTKQDNRFNMDVYLPKGRGKNIDCGVIASNPKIIEQAKKLGKITLSENDVKKLGKNKKELKKLAKKANFFLAEPKLMPIVGKEMGQVLGPKGKMPKPVPPNADLENMVKRFENTVTIKSKGKFLPTIQAAFGTEDMPIDDLNKNAEVITEKVIKSVKGQEMSIKSIYVKTSMGPSIRVELPWQKKDNQ